MTLSTGFRSVIALLALTVWLVPSTAVLAKGPVDMITATGSGLNSAVEITESDSLSPFDPWNRGFIDWGRGIIDEPPTGLMTYDVLFSIDLRGLVFEIQYSPDPFGGPGHIFIPSSSVNLGTIGTGDSDLWDPNGNWQHASTAWGVLMERELRGVSDEGEPINGRIDKITLAGSGIPRPIAVADPTSLARFVLGNAGLVDWQWRQNTRLSTSVTVDFLTDPPPVGQTYELVIHIEGCNGTSRVDTLRYYADPLAGGYVYRDEIKLVPGAEGTWVKATFDLDALMRQVLLENGVSPERGTEFEESDSVPASTEVEPGDTSRWQLAFASFGLLVGAMGLLWLLLRPKPMGTVPR
ncbi:MAG: hypothetical protein O3A47_11620 [Chloroflexi bacterium]|nr:hypothetical protein [Chloroflexota bacterium]